MSELRCIAGDSCRSSKDGQPGVTEQAGWLCDPCYAHIHGAVEQLPKDLAQLNRFIGEKTARAGVKVRSSQSSALLISAAKESLAAEIVEWLERAAAVVAERLHMDDTPAARRATPKARVDGEIVSPDRNTIADHAEELIRKPTPEQRAAAYHRVVEPNIDLLVAAYLGADPDSDNPALRDAADQATAFIWNKQGDDTTPEIITGMTIALRLVNIHHRVRAELGLTRKREKETLPCPDCQAEGSVGRWPGQVIRDCASCGATWTEGQWKWVTGRILDGKEHERLKTLLAEANSRLDKIVTMADNMADNVTITLAGAGPIILEALQKIIADHPTPKQRTADEARVQALKQQRAEDKTNWEWHTEPRHKRPQVKRKRHPVTTSTIANTTRHVTLEDPTYTGDETTAGVCRECNLKHPEGECP